MSSGHPWRGNRGGRSNRMPFNTYNRGPRFKQTAGHVRQTSMPSTNQKITDCIPVVSCPYHGWLLYISKSYNPKSELVRIIDVFECYLNENENILNSIQNNSFVIDLEKLFLDTNVIEKVPNLKQKMYDTPMTVIPCINVAAYQILLVKTEEKENCSRNFTFDSNLLIHARLVNNENITPLRLLKAILYGKLISVKGTVVRVSTTKPLCTVMAFECGFCKGINCVTQAEGKYVIPTSCKEPACSSRSFQPIQSHRLTKTVDWQNFKLQEIIDDNQREGGRVPRTVEVELTNDLVDSCIPGDIVTVTGIVKVLQSNQKSKGEQSMHLLYIDANSLVKSKSGCNISSSTGMEFTMKDYYVVEKIRCEPDLFRLLVGSLCPAIYGHEMVKAGMLLCIFGGCSTESEGNVSVRGEPHILVVGDPGLGKSQLLQACSNVTPRGVYVCGNTTTTSGLTVTLVRESGTGDFALEGGALVLADQGVCCIDEFDKMAGQHQALLETMEQQCISIAKAGVVCSLPARTSILGAANPVGGHYNKAKSVSENIKMNGALLSRFDLVFILLDKPNEEFDCLLSEHVMAIHSSTWNTLKTARPKISQQSLLDTSVNQADSSKCLRDALKIPNAQDLDLIPQQLMRTYISYSRKYVQPKMSVGASNLIQQFYLELRQKLQCSDYTPITARQLESLIRLSEARAKCELRDEVTEDDAKDVIEIMKFSMMDTYSDELGFLDFRRSQHGSGGSGRGAMKKFIAALQDLSESTYKTLFNMNEMQTLAKRMNLSIVNFPDFIANLNNQGYLLKKGPKIYQLLTAS